MNPLDPHNQLEEHQRDSAPDNSRFDGFDRGDLDRPKLVIIDDPVDGEKRLQDYDKLVAMTAADFEVVRLPRDPGKRPHVVFPLSVMCTVGHSPTPAVPTIGTFKPHTNPARSAKQSKRMSNRQFRRLVGKGYALKRAAKGG